MRTTLALLFAAGLIAACESKPPAVHEGESMEKRPKQPYPKYVFEKGPALADTEALVAWLDAQRAANRMVSLPFRLRRSGKAPGIGSAHVLGTEPPLAVRVGDTSLGIPLDDHFRRAAANGDEASLLLTGFWGDAENGVARFEVRRVNGFVPDGTTHAAAVVGEE